MSGPPLTARVKRGKTRAVSGIERMGEPKDDPELIDRENAFLLYASFSGDVERTSLALHADPIVVLKVADEEDWSIKLQSVIRLKKAGKPGDVERGVNRTMNFVQAHRMRNILERSIRELSEMSDEELLSYCIVESTTTHKDGSITIEKKIVTRPFADLASAMEKVHMLTYASLNDTTPERSKRMTQEQEDAPSSMEIHSAIAKAMSEVGASNTPRALLFDAQIAQSQALTKGPVQEIKDELAAMDAPRGRLSKPYVNDKATSVPLCHTSVTEQDTNETEQDSLSESPGPDEAERPHEPPLALK